MSDVLSDLLPAFDEYGRTMTLRRRVGTSTTSFTSVAVKGVARAFRPGELLGDIQQGDQTITITNREIAAAGWPGPPRRGDQFVFDGRIWTVQGANPRTLGETLLVYETWVRGG